MFPRHPLAIRIGLAVAILGLLAGAAFAARAWTGDSESSSDTPNGYNTSSSCGPAGCTSESFPPAE